MNRRDLLISLAGATAWPRGTRAQETAMPTIGFLHFGSPGQFTDQVADFLRGLGESGYAEGQNVTIEYRWAEGRYDRLPTLAAELVGQNVDVIVAGGPPATRAAGNATSRIPIVFIVGDDPVATGLIASLPRPGGNLAGVSLLTAELIPKRLELLLELVPHARVIALLLNPNFSAMEPIVRDAEEAARTKGVRLSFLTASTESEIDSAFATLVNLDADALVVGTDPFFNSRQEQLAGLAARYAVPAVYIWREVALAGGLIAYGPSISAAYRQAGTYVGRILKGAKRADLPVQQPTTFELVVNLKTAKELGLAVPPSILARATEVIE